MQPFTARAVAVIRGIPAGRVMTYGQVAEAAGSRRGARQVVRILHAMSEKHGLPWHRVVNAQGRIALADDEGRYAQRELLRQEGVDVDEDGRLDLGAYLHRDSSTDITPQDG
ncbi:DNA methyltransferase [Paenibacillus antri]|uniref:DNA methyltransferase n=1 Tax=Paenibacillus antri TaxID=2582848 RepID=A0A5R9G517_9BACL|nr:MGMT family protein [Paenibacillus antri]TLS49230.1 DNA methyltransferase [Paenibacillus antri]